MEIDDSSIADDLSHSRYVKLEIDEESAIDNGLDSSSDRLPSRITVSNLAASWTHVSML